ncbi:MAG: cell division protein FtsQ/DivIB [Gammaproteobacteria bacterium]
MADTRNQFSLSSFSSWLLSAAVLASAGLAWATWEKFDRYKADAAPIRYIRIEGVFEYLGKEEIKTALLPLVSTGFFDVDIAAVRRAAMNLPWVERVSVKRVWPDALAIKVQEQKAYVRWGEHSLLNPQGEKFSPANAGEFGHLLLLNCPQGQEREVLEIMKGLNTALADRSLQLAEFSIDERRAWRIVLADGMQILLGRNEQLKHFRRFLTTLALFEPEHIEAMATVDLRYPNGFAVTWKPKAAAIDWKKIAEQRQS